MTRYAIDGTVVRVSRERIEATVEAASPAEAIAILSDWLSDGERPIGRELSVEFLETTGPSVTWEGVPAVCVVDDDGREVVQ